MDMNHKGVQGHLLAVVTILIWGTTFISTKILLEDLQPVEILFYRFALGLAALYVVCPRLLRGTTIRQELYLAAAGFCGICMYYLLENIALTCTMASNVGVISSVVPFFTALLTHYLLPGEERLEWHFFAGFFLAMAGICLISFSGTQLALNPAGDLLAVLAAIVWACYSVLMRKISAFGYGMVLVTRRIFCYGLLFMLPVLVWFDFHWDLYRLVEPVNLFNIIFLGLGASALCFVTWNQAVRILGAVRTSIYLYMVPVITVVAAVLILQEQITLLAGVGIILTLLGLLVSEAKVFARKYKLAQDH